MKKHTVFEILALTILFCIVLSLIYIAYLQNTQIVELNNTQTIFLAQLAELDNTIFNLKNTHEILLTQLEAKNLEIVSLNEEVNMIKNLGTTSAKVDDVSELIINIEKITQFYIKRTSFLLLATIIILLCT